MSTIKPEIQRQVDSIYFHFNGQQRVEELEKFISSLGPPFKFGESTLTKSSVSEQTPKLTMKELSIAYERILPHIVSRTPNDESDDYRTLPEALSNEYDEFLRCFLLDSGRLKLSELGNPETVLDTISFLKQKRMWKDMPLMLKIPVFFGTETRETITHTEKAIHREMRNKSLRRLEASDRETHFKIFEYEAEVQARKQVLKEMNTPKSEEEFYKEHLNKELKKVM